MADLLHLEMAATMPWTVAEGGSLWIATGRRKRGGTFEDCLIRCVHPEMGAGNNRLFEVLNFGVTHGTGYVVSAAEITRAKEVFLVWADDPLTAVEETDQATVDHALRDRGLGS